MKHARVAAIAVAVGVSATAGVASAHAPVKSTSPRAGNTVPRSLAVVSVTFKSRIVAGSMVVRDADGSTVSRGDGSIAREGRQLRVRLRGLKRGRYKVSWRSVAANDSHLARKTFTFRVR